MSDPTTVNYIDNTKPLPPTIDLVTANPNGTVSVSGTAEPNSTVTVTFPDRTTGTYVVLADGKYGPVTSTTPQTSGTITATAKDVAGNVSDPASVIYTSIGGATAPTIVLTENPGGILEVNGKADPGSTVTVTFPDGTIKMVLTRPNGDYGPVKSDFPQPSGDVTAIAKDVLGATSPKTTVAYKDLTAPNAPIINRPITITPNGIVSVSGTAEPRSTVVVTFPDGTTVLGKVDDAGNFGPIVSINPQPSGDIKAKAIDINKNPSLEAKENIVIGGIALIKTGVLNDTNNDGFQQVGETITYSFKATNTGNVTLTDVRIEDLLPGIVMSGSPFSLAVGATNSVAYIGVYTLKQSDIITGSVSNQATVSGKTPAYPAFPALTMVSDKSDDSSIVEDDTTVVTTDGCVIEVFNGMTPGNDGVNDVFYIRGIECFPNNSIQIFNRWGIVVFDKTGYNNTDRAFRGLSDGNLTVAKSEELPVGTYYYVFKYTDNASMSYEKAGYLYINK